MKPLPLPFWCVVLAVGIIHLPIRGATLWEIGKPERGNAEFALASTNYAAYRDAGFHVVGKAAPERDWPYVHPGPSDAWAGGQSHTFTVLFAVGGDPGAGEVVLRLGVLDAHPAGPPRLSVRLNEEAREQVVPAGSGDGAVRGQFGEGPTRVLEFTWPAGTLVRGENQLRITTTSGSWFLYDWLRLEGPEGVVAAETRATTVVDAVLSVRALRREGEREVQPVEVRVRHFGAPVEATVTLRGTKPARVTLGNRPVTVEFGAEPVRRPTPRRLEVAAEGRVLASAEVVLEPVRPLTVYVLPHSHTDIGYTEIQTAIEARQVENLRKGIEYARRTEGYPAGSRFVWNVEVLWAAHLYLHRMAEAERAEFFEAVKRGQVVLNGMYLNELTGLCRPEELIRLFEYSTELAGRTGVPIDSAMISDVPGYTWGTVTAMAHAGIRYLSTAPNYFDRIGDILRQWENRPFWWIGPSGRERVLVWIPFKGYALSHIYRSLSPALVTEFQRGLDTAGYEFDIAYVRWSGHGDNAEPDPSICEFIRDWNAKYVWPRFVISGTGEAFRAFEQRYGERLPEVRGDWTPYWEDGAGSSALETAMNRASADRVIQAEALDAVHPPVAGSVAESRPGATEFTEAWNQVLLYSEHTWGAWCSVSDPESQATREQWEIKRSYALEADRRSRDLLARTAPRPDLAGEGPVWFDVRNTTSWPRTEVVVVPADQAGPGNRVEDAGGGEVPSQRLSNGDLAFLVRDIPALGRASYRLTNGVALALTPVKVSPPWISNERLAVRIDERTGAVAELKSLANGFDYVDGSDGEALNEFWFLPGDRVEDRQRNGPVRMRVRENGRLVGSIVVESGAPGCRGLTREIRLTAGSDVLELANLVDKERAAIPGQPNDWQFAQKGGKEAVHFAFPFRVPDGQLRLELPFGVIRPDRDLIPSACKNWFTVGRWADVSNRDHGIAWVTLDAPLVEVGGITATLVGSQSNPDVWRKKVEPTRRLYSWAMNNHWGTNYRAYQDGPVTFRFALRPHGPFDAAENTRLAVGLSQPLIVVPRRSAPASAVPRFQVEPSGVVVTGLKRSRDGRALIVRLYGASGGTSKASLKWSEPLPVTVTLSDTSERPGPPVRGAVEVPGYGLVTLRAEFAASPVP